MITTSVAAKVRLPSIRDLLAAVDDDLHSLATSTNDKDLMVNLNVNVNDKKNHIVCTLPLTPNSPDSLPSSDTCNNSPSSQIFTKQDFGAGANSSTSTSSTLNVPLSPSIFTFTSPTIPTPPSSQVSPLTTTVSTNTVAPITQTPCSSVSKKAKKPRCRCRNFGENGRIPRPRNAFILFRQHLHHSVFGNDKDMLQQQGSFKTNSQVSREIGQRWRQLDPVEKNHWHDMAKREKELHRQKYPNYKYIPRKMETSQTIEGCQYCKGKK